jgi:Flp pilus assembly protein TadD
MASSHPRASAVVGEDGSNLLAVITLVATLGFVPWVSSAEQPWGLLAFRVLGLAALAATALWSARGHTISRWGARAATASILLAALTALSAILSVHRGKSLEAMLNLLAIMGLFLAAALLIRGARRIRLVAVVEVFAAVPVALLGIAQHFRPDLLPADNSYPGRALGPFGQPNRLGGYLIAAIPLCVALAFAVHDRALRLALLLAVLILAFSLVTTYSRGAWIGLGAGLVTLAALLVRWPALRPEPALAAVAAALILLPVLFALPSIAARLTPRAATSPAWNLPIDPEREGSGAMRRAVWSGALAAMAARPVLGWGVGAFREAFDRSKSATLRRLEAEGGRTADQAHSYFLETLSERGVLGLAAFLMFVSVILAGGLAALGTGAPAEARLLSAGLFASIVALLAHALFEDNLSFAAHGAVFAVNAGLLTAAAPRGASERKSLPRRSFAIAGVVIALLAVGTSGVSALAASTALDARAELRSGQPTAALAGYGKAAKLASWDDRYALGAASAAQAVAVSDPSRAAASLMDAEKFYRQAIAANPNDPVTRHELARLYLGNPGQFGDRGVHLAITELQTALAQNPYYAEIRNDLGVALVRTGDDAGAAEAFRAASEGRRTFVDPLLNLAALAVRHGDRAEAARKIDEALARDPESVRARAMKAEITGDVR